MKIKFLLLASAFLGVTACRTPLNIAKISPEKNISLSKDLPEAQNFKDFIEPYKQEVEGKMNTKISHTNIELNKSGDNSNLGNLLADYTFEGADEWAKKNNFPPIDAAVINIGGIRTIIPKGDILTKQIYEVMPFENEIVIVKMTGKDVEGLFHYYMKTQKNNPVSHILIETDDNSISKKLINGKSVDEGKTYYIATSDYLALGGDNMFFFSKGQMIQTGIKMRDLFLEKFKQNPEISAPDDVRLVFKNKKVQE